MVEPGFLFGETAGRGGFCNRWRGSANRTLNLQIERVILQIERAKLQIERKNLQIERAKLQIEPEQGRLRTGEGLV